MQISALLIGLGINGRQLFTRITFSASSVVNYTDGIALRLCHGKSVTCAKALWQAGCVKCGHHLYDRFPVCIVIFFSRAADVAKLEGSRKLSQIREADAYAYFSTPCNGVTQSNRT